MGELLRTIMLLAVLAVAVPAQAGNDDTDYNGRRLRNSVAVSGALTSSDTWQLELSYQYSSLKFVGIGVGLGYWSQYGENGSLSGSGWRVSDDFKYCSNLYLRPNFQLTTPTLLSIQDCGCSLFLNPGAMLNIPYGRVNVDLIAPDGVVAGEEKVSTHNGNWTAFDLRCGLRLSIDQLRIAIGYKYSNLDVYGMRRNLKFQGTRFGDYYPDRECQHALVLELSYSF